MLVKPWGLNLDWQRLSYASLVMVGLWILMALARASAGTSRRSAGASSGATWQPAEVRLTAPTSPPIETLVQELAHPDADRVVYAIDVLESLDKRNLVTPLLLYHESPRVRARALGALGAARSDIASAVGAADPPALVAIRTPRCAPRAISALGAISNEDAATLARPMLADADPRIRATAAVALAAQRRPADVDAAEAALLRASSPTRRTAARHARRDVADRDPADVRTRGSAGC